MNQSTTLPAGLEVRLYRPRDYVAVSALFSELFKQPMSTAFHAWKYRPGKSGAVVVFKDGELVAHYGGLGAAVSLRGQESSAMQIVDVMVKPSARQSVRKHSPFFLAGSRFLEQFVGTEQPWLLGYGFPSDRHMRLAAHLGLYAPVGHMLELSWPSAAMARRPSWWWQVERLDATNVGQAVRALDGLWLRMQKDLQAACAVIKDGAWLRWRYLDHPECAYELRLVRQRFSGQALGLLVYKVEGARLLLLDLVAPKAFIPALIGLAAAEAQQRGLATLATWSSQAFIDWFPSAQRSSRELAITTPANIWTAGPAPASVQDLWWLLPGDTDFL